MITRFYYEPDGTILSCATTKDADGQPRSSLPFVEVPGAVELDITRHHVVEGEVVERTVLTEAQRQAALERIAAMRADKRAEFITDGAGQDMVYLNKERRAAEYIADPNPDPADYPTLQAEVGTTGQTVEEVAQVILNLAAIWETASAAIEGLYYVAQADIQAATTLAEADAAVANMQAGLAAI